MGVALAVYATAGLSGAHLNPAVTIALWKFACFDGKKSNSLHHFTNARRILCCRISLCLIPQCFIDYETVHNIVRGTQESLSLAGTFSTYPHPSLSIGGFAVEFVITAILMALIMALTDDGNGVPRGPLAPLLIGILIAVIGGAMGPLTGFAMNPARDFDQNSFAYLAGWGELALTGGREIPYFIVPMVAPVLGALAGAWLYKSNWRQFTL